MNTQNVNVKTAASESTERWDEKALDSLNSLQMSVSNALLDYQRCPDKARLETQTSRLMEQLEVQTARVKVVVASVDSGSQCFPLRIQPYFIMSTPVSCLT
ncbi:hypothetical protein ACQYEX_004476 [Salmonella enterica]